MSRGSDIIISVYACTCPSVCLPAASLGPAASVSQFPAGVTLGRGDPKVGTFKGTQNVFMEGRKSVICVPQGSFNVPALRAPLARVTVAGHRLSYLNVKKSHSFCKPLLTMLLYGPPGLRLPGPMPTGLRQMGLWILGEL